MKDPIELKHELQNFTGTEPWWRHNLNDGEVPGEDCQYAAFLKEADAVLKGVENA